MQKNCFPVIFLPTNIDFAYFLKVCGVAFIWNNLFLQKKTIGRLVDLHNFP